MVQASALPPVLEEASAETRVLLVHAPYPGRLKFDGQPTSLLSASTPLVRALAAEGKTSEVGYLDPRTPSPEFYARLHELAARGRLRVACISTSTAAIEEAKRIAAAIRTESPETLILAGGPHEDDCEEPVASRVSAVDVSVAGDGGDALCFLARAFLAARESRLGFLGSLSSLLGRVQCRGSAAITCRQLGTVSVGRRDTAPPADELLFRPWLDRTVRFDVFPERETLPLMVSRGCAYGRCTFCGEANSGAQRVASDFRGLRDLIASRPGAALYFQDSIFPSTRIVRTELLPLLRDSGRPWGCQVYLPALSAGFAKELASHGCVYVYTGLESASEEIRSGVGKATLRDSLVYSKLALLANEPIRVGISLMFGAMDGEGRLLETEHTVALTEAFADRIASDGIDVAGFYPNVLTVLPGTTVARGLARAGHKLDFYSMPRVPAFADLEDGGVGYNFESLGLGTDRLVARIADASRRLSSRMLAKNLAPKV